MPSKLPDYDSDLLYYYPVDYGQHTYIVADAETTIRNRGEDAVGSQSGSPHHPNNRVCYWGCSEPQPVNSAVLDLQANVYDMDELQQMKFIERMRMSNLMVGHNFKFDMLYMLKEFRSEFDTFIAKGGRIWDTMIVEYLLSNQMEQFVPLSSKYRVRELVYPDGTPYQSKEITRQGLAVKYGGTDKDERIAEYWNNGIDTPEIPKNEIKEYAVDDIINTHTVFRGQINKARARGQEFMNLIMTQMDALVATTYMEYNGMHFDMDKCAPKAKSMAEKFDKLHADLQNEMAEELEIHREHTIPRVENEDCNPNSNQQIATILFGGVFKYRKQVDVLDDDGNPVVYKSGAKAGQIKTKWTDFVIDIPSSVALCDAEELAISKTDGGSWQVDDANLQKCEKDSPTLINKLLKYRKLDKDLNTYYLGLMELVWPNDSCIHGNLNHCSTATGRLSSSAPNMQNISG